MTLGAAEQLAKNPNSAEKGLPAGWMLARMGDLVDITSGKFIKRSEYSQTPDKPYPVAGAGGPIGWTDRSNFKAPIMTLGRVGAAGALNLYQSDAWVTDNALVIQPTNEDLFGLFALFFRTINWADLHTGSSQPLITQALVKQLLIPLAPLAEQKRIVAKVEQLLTRVNAARERLAKVPAILKRFRQSVLAAACSGRLTAEWREKHPDVEPASLRLERIREQRKNQKAKVKTRNELSTMDISNLSQLPTNWEWTRVGEISDRIHYGYTARSQKEPIGPKLLRITDIQNGAVNWKTVPHCKIGENEKMKYLLEEGDLVFARTGATVGKSYLLSGEFPETVFASYLIRIIINDGVSKEFVRNFFQSLSYWSQITSGQVGIGQPNVNAQILSEIILPFPPFAEQQEIVRCVEGLFRLADAIEKRVAAATAQAEKLTQSILAKAFRGELVTTEAELARREARSYETASALLAKIEAQRKAVKPQRKRRGYRRKRNK